MDDGALVESVATILDAQTAWVWRSDGSAYPATETAIFYGRINTTPNRACGITLYATSDDLSEVSGPRRLQLRFRSDPNKPRDADDMAQDAFDVLHGLMRVGGIHLMKRVSSAQLGIDGNGRRERADNYEIQPELEA